MALYERNLYDLFKASLIQAVNERLLTIANSQSVQKSSDQAAKNLRLKWLKIVSQSVESNFDRFKSSLYQKISNSVNRNNPYSYIQGDRLTVFPKGTKLWFRGDNAIAVVIEQPPQVRTFHFATDQDGCPWTKNEYRLSVPYCEFFIVFTLNGNEEWQVVKWQIAFSNRPITSEHSEICQAALPDINGMELCLGKMAPPAASTDIASQCDAILEYFWQSQFRWEWVGNYAHIVGHGKHFSDLEDWERQSTDPLVALSVPWKPTGTVFGVLAKLSLEHPIIVNYKLSDKTINNAIAESWDEVQTIALGELKDLEAEFIGQLSSQVTAITNHLVQQSILTLDGAVSSATDPHRLDALGYQQVPFEFDAYVTQRRRSLKFWIAIKAIAIVVMLALLGLYFAWSYSSDEPAEPTVEPAAPAEAPSLANPAA